MFQNFNHIRHIRTYKILKLRFYILSDLINYILRNKKNSEFGIKKTVQIGKVSLSIEII